MCFHFPESEDKCDSERPVNSSIIWCLSCLIKHIIDHPWPNDSHPITHESSGFGITTTWPRCGLTGLTYRGQSVSTVHRCNTPASPVACLWMWRSALPKTVGGKNAITARLSYCFRLTFLTEFMNIYESILHLNLETPHHHPHLSPPHLCFAGGIFFVSSKCVLTARLKCYPEKPRP